MKIDKKEKAKFFKIDEEGDIKKQVDFSKKKKFDGKERLFLEMDYLNIGFYLIIPILVGIILGFYLKKVFRNDSMVIVFILLGSLGSFYNLFKLTKK